MMPLYHAVFSSLAAVPYYFVTGSPVQALCFASTGVLIDIDHSFDFILWAKRPLKLKTLLTKGSARHWPRQIFLFHSHELFIILIIASAVTGSKSLWAIALGGLFHLIEDEIGNRMPSNPTRIYKPFYFFTYRLANGFRRTKISCPRNNRNL